MVKIRRGGEKTAFVFGTGGPPVADRNPVVRFSAEKGGEFGIGARVEFRPASARQRSRMTSADSFGVPQGRSSFSQRYPPLLQLAAGTRRRWLPAAVFGDAGQTVRLRLVLRDR